MEYILLGCTVLLSSLRAVFTKILNKGEASFHKQLKTNAYMFAFAFITVLLIGITSLSTMFQVPWWLAIVFAVSMVLAQVCFMKAVELGPVSTSNLISNCGFIIPLLFGSIYYQEKVNALHIIGVLLILLSFIFSLKKEDKKINLLWFLTAFGSFLFGGVMGIWQKIFSYEYSQYALDNFMQVAFLLMLVFSFCIVVLFEFGQRAKTQKKIEPSDDETGEKKIASNLWIKLGFIVALGASIGLINKINTFLSGVLPSVIVFPCISGGGIIATTVLSMIIFKEKPTNMQKISLLVSILGIVLISIGAMLV